MRPVAQAIALGPVPAGSMKPQLAAIAAGSASRSGSAPSATVRLATTGMMPLAVATLLANSVIRITSATTATATIHRGSAESGSSDWPSQAARPEAVIPAASASPPPNIMITSHGARLASGQVSSGRPVPSGTTNSSRPTNTAIVPSVSAPSGRRGSVSGWVTQSRKASANSGTRRFSCTVQSRWVAIAACAAATSNRSSPTRCTRAMISAASGTPSKTSGTP